MHPATLWTITRKSVVPNPSAHRQWNATGKESMNARLPLQRCSTEPQAGAAPAPGRRPHIHSAVTSCTISKATAAVPSQTFICSIPENPRVNSGRPAGVWTLAYTPKVTATAAPASSTATSPARLVAARRSVAMDIARPLPAAVRQRASISDEAEPSRVPAAARRIVARNANLGHCLRRDTSLRLGHTDRLGLSRDDRRCELGHRATVAACGSVGHRYLHRPGRQVVGV